MKLLIVLVTHNRLAYTQRTLKALKKTIILPHYLVAFDNNSSDGTQDWLRTQRKQGVLDLLILSPENLYPGAAANRGWQEGLKHYQPTHLMRLDNDFTLKDGWDIKARDYFLAFPLLGQLGLDWDAIKDSPQTKLLEAGGLVIDQWPGNIGGTNILKKEVWDKGVRYDETPWHHTGGVLPTPQEDVKLSLQIQVLGYQTGHMTDKLAWTFANPDNWNDFPEYYQKTMKERGYDFDSLSN